MAGIFPYEAAIARLVEAMLAEQNDGSAVQRAKYVTLGAQPANGDNELVNLPSAAT